MSTQAINAKSIAIWNHPMTRIMRRSVSAGGTVVGLYYARKAILPDKHSIISSVRRDVREGIVSYDQGLKRCLDNGISELECFSGCKIPKKFLPKNRNLPFAFINLSHIYTFIPSIQKSNLVSSVPTEVFIFVGISTLYFIGEISFKKF